MKMCSTSFLFFGSLVLFLLACTDAPAKRVIAKEVDTTMSHSTPPLLSAVNDSIMTDPRDGNIYAIASIGTQTWMAENLRYEIPGSEINPDYPSSAYGRLYDGKTAQKVCPKGWHLPADVEWNILELFLGMPITDISKTFWRGEHGTKMKSTTGWADGQNGTNSSGFNGLPAGFYFSEDEGKDNGLDGLGQSVGYWSALDGGKAWIRFLGAPLEGVNRFDDDKLDWKLACRCVRN